jgi:hypothetical protein
MSVYEQSVTPLRMSFHQDVCAYIEYESGRSVKNWVVKWLTDHQAILHDSLRDMSDDTPEYYDLGYRIDTITDFLRFRLMPGDLLTLYPNDAVWIKEEVETYRDFLKDEAIPEATNTLMKYVMKSELNLISAILNMWPTTSVDRRLPITSV